MKKSVIKIKILLLIFILSPITFADKNNQLDINLIGTLAYGGGRVTCDEFVKIRSEYKQYNLFKDGIPKCEGKEVPDAWIETKNSVNSYAEIHCAIPCAVYQMPLYGSLSGNYLGHIRSSQTIFLKDEIKTIKNAGNPENLYPWYREWYSFEYKGDIYFTTKRNIKKIR